MRRQSIAGSLAESSRTHLSIMGVAVHRADLVCEEDRGLEYRT